ncbi:MAG: PDZ domain-containing protein [Planctomycetota bacterium]|nr:MAG: PDZ domain-containing protein [Planctomycetota bacterium]
MNFPMKTKRLTLLFMLALLLPTLSKSSEKPHPPKPGWLGATFRSYYDPQRNLRGVRILHVVPFSPAGKANLQPNDVIYQVDRSPTPHPLQLIRFLRQTRPGQKIQILLYRPKTKQLKRTQLTLGEKNLRKICQQSIELAAKWLISRQLPNGGWPHFLEAQTRAAAPTTALCLAALSALPNAKRYHTSIEKGLQYLLRQRTKSGMLGDVSAAVKMETYTTALAIIALCQYNREKYQRTIQELVSKLKDAQLDNRAGFSEYDIQYGGWNYFEGKRRSVIRVDVSVASYVLEAFAAANVPRQDPLYPKVLKYLSRCQNVEEGKPLNSYLDGGFHFGPLDGKAGIYTAPDGNDYFRSYGSPTCDGLRSLLYCGLSPNDYRVQGALTWISKHFTLKRNPGFTTPGPLNFQDGILFYYYASLSKALAQYGRPYLQHKGKKILWANKLVLHLASRQSKEGHWKNSKSVMHEDRLELATALALIALAKSYPFLKN